jgi:hypothetical protein
VGLVLRGTSYIYLIFFETLLLQDKLLSKLEENEPELATSQEDEVSFVSLKHIYLKANTRTVTC